MRPPVGPAVGGALLAALTLAACDRSAPSVERGAPTDVTTPMAAPASAQADFVGVWAATPDACSRNETWRFTPDRLAAAGGVTCALDGAARSPTGWSLQAVCSAQGQPRPANLQLSTPTPEGTMTVSGGPFTTPAPLVRCTPSLQAGA